VPNLYKDIKFLLYLNSLFRVSPTHYTSHKAPPHYTGFITHHNVRTQAPSPAATSASANSASLAVSPADSSTSPAQQIELHKEHNIMAVKASTDFVAVLHDPLKGAVKTRSSLVDKREDT
jgi:hypothetical protein